MTARLDRFAQRRFGARLQLLQNLRRNFLRQVAPALNFHPDRPGPFAAHGIGHQHFLARDFRPAPAHEAFDGIHRLRRMNHPQAGGRTPHHRRSAGPRKMDHRRRQPLSLRIRDHVRDAASTVAISELVVPRSMPTISFIAINLKFAVQRSKKFAGDQGVWAQFRDYSTGRPVVP